MNKVSNKSGFSLIELLVVIVIVVMLISIAVVVLVNARMNARDARRLADLRQIKQALEMYKNDKGSYPNSQGGAGPWDGLYTPLPGDSLADWIPGLVSAYINALPRDPRNNTTPSQQYIYNSDGKDYKLISYNPENITALKKNYPGIADPQRPNNAVGFWTSGATNW